MTSPRFDAVLFDAGGVLVMPDPGAMGGAIEHLVGHHAVSDYRRAHHAGLRALERHLFSLGPGAVGGSVSLERENWNDYLAGYAISLGLAPDRRDDAVSALRRVFSSFVWRARIEDSIGALGALHGRGVPMGVVSNASGQIESTLRYQGVCQVGVGAGVPVRCVVDSHVVGVAKPDPGIFAPALEALDLPDPSRVAYVGDSSINDVIGAAAAGLTPLQLDPFDHYPDADHERIRSVWELLDWV
ncbi:MAG: HAD family hydrolase [Ilumatobacteraceae bacterium]